MQHNYLDNVSASALDISCMQIVVQTQYLSGHGDPHDEGAA